MDPRNTGREVEIHPRWDATPSQGTLQTNVLAVTTLDQQLLVVTVVVMENVFAALKIMVYLISGKHRLQIKCIMT